MLRTVTIVCAIACALASVLLADSAVRAAEWNKFVPVPGANASAQPVATDVRVGGDDKQTRFVVDLSQKVDVTAFALADPYRVVVDLPQLTFKLAPNAGERGRGLVKAFRYGLIMQ